MSQELKLWPLAIRWSTCSSKSVTVSSNISHTRRPLCWELFKGPFHTVMLMSYIQAKKTLKSLPAYFFFSILFSTPSFSQSSLSISRTEEPQCHPGSCRTQPCGHQRYLCQHGFLRPWPHRHTQEAAEPHGGCTLWWSWYGSCLYIDGVFAVWWFISASNDLDKSVVGSNVL